MIVTARITGAVWLTACVAVLLAGRAVGQPCNGDCDGGGDVTVAEMQTGAAIAIGAAPLNACPAIDGDGDGQVTIAELTRATAEHLAGCGQVVGIPRTGGTVELHVGSTVGAPGGSATFDVTIAQNGEAAVAAQIDIAFSPQTPIRVGNNNRPACTVNPAIAREASQFVFMPPGCSGVTCNGIRAIILSFMNVAVIADGSNLFTCTVDIAANVAAGNYALVGSNAATSDGSGSAIFTRTDTGVVAVGAFPARSATAAPTPTSPPAPASLILRSGRLHAEPANRDGVHRGWIRLDGVVNTNAPFGGLLDDLRNSGMRVVASTTAGAQLELLWKAIACVAREGSRGPTIFCLAEDAAGWRKVVVRPTGTPNLLALHVIGRRLALPGPLTDEPLRAAVVTTTFERDDELGGCTVQHAGALKMCHESGVLPSPTVSATPIVTSTPTSLLNATRTMTATRLVTATRTMSATRTAALLTVTATMTVTRATATSTATVTGSTTPTRPTPTITLTPTATDTP